MISEDGISGWALFWIIWLCAMMPLWAWATVNLYKRFKQKETIANDIETRLAALEKELLNKDNK